MTERDSDTSVVRGHMLLSHSRPDLAERELRQALAVDPNDPYAHALLAVTLRELERLPEATTEAQTAIHLAPDDPLPHYALATVLHARDRIDEALTAIEEAIRLSPDRADYYARLSAIRLDQRRWADALSAAERGLEIDPEHVACNNLRAMALVQMGRRTEAGVTIATTLARDPDNSVTHANQGWTLLHAGDATGASTHFREALRLDPTSAWAREGIVEALKARNPIYAVLLRYTLWMARLSNRGQWIVVLVGFFGYRFLAGILRTNPSLAPVIVPLMVAYGLFALMTWIGDPVFTLLLRLDSFGRHAVTEEQIARSNWVGLALLAGAIGFVAVFITAGVSEALVAGLALAGLSIPLSAVFRMPRGWPRQVMSMLTGVLAALGVLGVVLTVFGAGGSGFTALAIVGILLSTWAANFLAMTRPKR
jgi:tetratricopeptide (TPR) repeat protein